MAGPNDGLPKSTVALDRTTPRRSLEGFVQAVHASDLLRAAYYLDLRGVPRGQQATDGPMLARELSYVIDQKLIVDYAKVDDSPEGGVAPQAAVVIGSVVVDDEPVPISLTRVRCDDGVMRWLVSRTTLSMVPPLWNAYGAHEFEEKLPPWLARRVLGNAVWQWLALFGLLVGSYVVGRIVSAILVSVARRLARQTKTPWDDAIIEAARRPLRMLLTVLTLRAAVEPLHLTANVQMIAERISYTFLVVGGAWFVMRSVSVGSAWIAAHIPDDPLAEQRTRGMRTQLAVMERVTSVILVIVAAAVVLIQFDFVRSVGLSLLASAGIAGIVLGIAAQKSLAGVIAGIQLSITQPIRIGDVVVIENEQGEIEEISLTYVTVRVWDGRRLMVPIGRFLDQPFQNWTKTSRELLGTVLMPVDFLTPIDRLRDEVTTFCENHPAWDRRRCRVQVTDMSDRSMTLRAVVSSANADDLWTLRCDLREHLVTVLQKLDSGAHFAKQRTLNTEELSDKSG